jgi:RNA polymerase sigma-70 factor (ECF subfamily)
VALSGIVERVRPLLFGIAYRMVGTVGDAEDIVQEAFLRLHRETVEVRSPEAFLTTVTTRLAIDHLRSARVRRETYVGPWLPEPLIAASEEEDPAVHAEMADTLSLAFLVLLERLTPQERAAFLLREVFGQPYGEIAQVLDRSEESCRQLVARAKRHIDAERPRFDVDRRRHEEITDRFVQACATGDIEALTAMLAADAVLVSDGGGNFPAARKPVAGAARVAKALAGITRQRAPELSGVDRVTVNGRPGLLLRATGGAPQSVVALDVVDGLIQTVRTQVNPEKLRHLG